jgi:hypothetical protein
MRTHSIAVLFALLALTSLSATPALAQRWLGPTAEPSEDAVAEARELYAQGSEAAEEQRWSDAIDLFEISYSLSGASVALFSLGYTLRAVGQFQKARDAFDQLLEDARLDPELRAQSTALRDEVASKIAILRLVGLDDYDAPSVELDGAPAGDSGDRPLSLEMDPGEHNVSIGAEGFEEFTWDGRLAQGDRVSVDVELEPAGDSILKSPWLWAGVGAAVVLAIVIAAVVVQSNAQLAPREENHLSL